MTSYLSYWIPDTAWRELARGGPLDHAASQQYRRVNAGDIVYVVTVQPPGHLVLLGRIRVEHRVDRATAIRLMQKSDLWQADWHIIAAPGTAQRIVDIDISDIANQLTFVSKRPRLDVEGGLVRAQQLQSMRQLTASSAARLDARLAEWFDGPVMRPSPQLAKVVGTEPMPRLQIVQILWDYIVSHGLVDRENPDIVSADKVLRRIFGADQLSMPEVAEAVNRHLTPA
jgi:hypothetical protein